MQAIKCDRCRKYYDENRNFVKSAIFFADGNGVIHGEKIDLCDECMDEVEAWLSNAALENDWDK